MDAPAGRTIAIWSPDWPVLTAVAAVGLAPEAPAAVLSGGVVLSCTARARAAGVRRGLRRREAQYRCPELAVLDRDLAEEARAFEPVVAAVEAVAPGVEVVRPGLCAVSARGPARYFGGDEPAAVRLADEASAAGPGDSCLAGVAEGPFAAALAARRGAVVPAGRTPEFLAAQSLEVIDRPELVDLLRRLGLRTLGEFAQLPAPDVMARFGSDGVFVHRLARGLDPRPPDARVPPPDLVVSLTLDPPADSVERAAFAARRLADQLQLRLAAAGLGCTRVSVEAETESGERHTRVWRHEGVLTAAAIAERVRWQLDGWLATRPGAASPARARSGIAVLRLAPDEVIEHAGEQLGLWAPSGADADAAARAGRALSRVQGLLGQPSVQTAVVGGGRGPGERVRYVTWGDPRESRRADGPWPGRVPEPSPALVPPIPVPAVLIDESGAPVAVTARYALSGAPARLVVGREPPRRVLSWAGPWPADERWWDSAKARLRIRFQVATADGAGWLLLQEDGMWFVEAVYD
ncbi:MAG TPA: DNA polymerase Y family protein [Sporichthyaceae bacterium]|nr:DNA polymerase Y family protein [Sporichthyaceae bacterium]